MDRREIVIILDTMVDQIRLEQELFNKIMLDTIVEMQYMIEDLRSCIEVPFLGWLTNTEWRATQEIHAREILHITQYYKRIIRRNRLLPVGHRCRGDVLIF